MRTTVCGILLAATASLAATDSDAVPMGVAIGSIPGSSLSAASQYILRSTVYEQLKSRGVPTMEANGAPYIYLAKVGYTKLERGCVYRVSANLLDNSPIQNTGSEPAARVPLWSREFTSQPVDCDKVSERMTSQLDAFAAEFSRDSANGKLREAAVKAAKQ